MLEIAALCNHYVYIFAQVIMHLLASLEVLLLEELGCEASILYDFQYFADSDVSLVEGDLQTTMTLLPHQYAS